MLRHSKRTTAGREERLELLEIHFPPVRKWCVVVMEEFRRSGNGADDILDALALGMSAAELPGQLTPIPESPEKDSRGLPMRIWHPRYDETSPELMSDNDPGSDSSLYG